MIRMNSHKTVLMPKSLEDNQVQMDNICKAFPLEGFCRVKTAREGGRGQGALTRDAKVLSNRGYMSIFPPEGPILSIR